MGGKTTTKFRKSERKLFRAVRKERSNKEIFEIEGSGRGRSHLALPRDLGKCFSSTFQLGLGGKGSSGWLILPLRHQCQLQAGRGWGGVTRAQGWQLSHRCQQEATETWGFCPGLLFLHGNTPRCVPTAGTALPTWLRDAPDAWEGLERWDSAVPGSSQRARR